MIYLTEGLEVFDSVIEEYFLIVRVDGQLTLQRYDPIDQERKGIQRAVDNVDMGRDLAPRHQKTHKLMGRHNKREIAIKLNIAYFTANIYMLVVEK